MPRALIEGTMRHDIAQMIYTSKVYVPCPYPIWLLLVFNFYYFPNIKKETIIVIIAFLLSYVNEVTQLYGVGIDSLLVVVKDSKSPGHQDSTKTV